MPSGAPSLCIYICMYILSMHACMIYIFRPEAKHQSFKRMTKCIFWPQMLTQMVQKHNMRNAWELGEHMHVNHKMTLYEGTIIDDRHLLRPGQQLFLALVEQSTCSIAELVGVTGACITGIIIYRQFTTIVCC